MSDNYYWNLGYKEEDFKLNDTTNITESVFESWPGKGNYGLLLFWTNAQLGYVGFSAPITGWLLILCFCILSFFALPFIRRNGYFQVCSRQN